MVLPKQSYKIDNMIYYSILSQALIAKTFLLLNIISQRHHNISGTSIHHSIALQDPFLFADVIRAHLTCMLEYTLKQVPMDIQKL